MFQISLVWGKASVFFLKLTDSDGQSELTKMGI